MRGSSLETTSDQVEAPSSALGTISKHMKTNGKVRTACSLCLNFCGVIAYVENGKITKIEGDPDNPRNHGHLCAKGLAGAITAYSPNRVTKPLIRTNPKKGLSEDPRWKEISWEEALDRISFKVKETKEKTERELGIKLSEKPSTTLPDTHPWSQKIIFATFDYWSIHGIQLAWVKALDAYLCALSACYYCGNSVHPPSYLNTSTFEVMVDAEYSKYILLIGAQAGSIIHYDTMNVAKHIAENRPGKVKVVSIDPVAGYAASKAEEWVPIRPGTDAAFVLSLVNLLINDYRIFDAEFLKSKTNAPYLVDSSNGLYIRDQITGKPMIWDRSASGARPFDQVSPHDQSLEGTFNVNGVACKTAFQMIKEHVRAYSPEEASRITAIPPETIKRIARELGDAACIGKTIRIGGKDLPYRPVSIVWYRGLSAHRHSFLAGLACILLPTILGAIQVPGSIHGHPPAPETIDKDGMMVSVPPWLGEPYPPRTPTRPKRVDVFELFPSAIYSMQLIPAVLKHPEKFGIDPKEFVWPEIMFIFRDNVVKNSVSPEEVIEGFSKIPYIVDFSLDLDETANSLADIVLPELHHLEKLAEGLYHRVEEPGYWYGAKPVIRPPFEAPWNELVSNGQVFLEIAKRAGFDHEIFNVLNDVWSLKGTRFQLNPANDYTYEDLIDRRLKVWLGQDKGLNWLMSDEGGLTTWEIKPEEKYPGAFRKGRIHVYFEFMLKAKKELDNLTKEIGLSWDTDDYQPIPDWKPCPSFKNKNEEFNLFLVNYKVPVLAHAVGRYNPLARKLVFARKHIESVLINPITAEKLGVRDGDQIEIETWKGRKRNGVVEISERIHPEVLGTSQHELVKGVDFNYLVTLDEDTLDFTSGAIDACLLVKIKKVEQKVVVH